MALFFPIAIYCLHHKIQINIQCSPDRRSNIYDSQQRLEFMAFPLQSWLRIAAVVDNFGEKVPKPIAIN